MTNEQYNELLVRQLALEEEIVEVRKVTEAALATMLNCERMLHQIFVVADVYMPFVRKYLITPEMQAELEAGDLDAAIYSWRKMVRRLDNAMVKTQNDLLKAAGIDIELRAESTSLSFMDDLLRDGADTTEEPDA